MTQFTYSALNERGRRIRGSMVAENEIDLESRLKEVGLDLINYRNLPPP
jgi:type II secretory pathway component PulF